MDVRYLEVDEVLRLRLLERIGAPGGPSASLRPEISLSSSALLVWPRPAADRVGGPTRTRVCRSCRSSVRICEVARLRVIEEQLAELVRRRGGRSDEPVLRVITTTYIGATERRALDRLVELGASVKISDETRMTRLRAKAWASPQAGNAAKASARSGQVGVACLVAAIGAAIDPQWIEQPFGTVTLTGVWEPGGSLLRRKLDAPVTRARRVRVLVTGNLCFTAGLGGWWGVVAHGTGSRYGAGR